MSAKTTTSPAAGKRIPRTGLTLGFKALVFGAGIVLMTAIALVSLAVWQSGRYNRLAQGEVDGLIDSDLDNITQGIYNLVVTEDEGIQQQSSADLKHVQRLLAETRVRQEILRTRVGGTGYVYVLQGSGENRGRYIISQRGERDGENIWGSMDSAGHPVIQEIIAKAVALRPGELATAHYPWQNPGEKAPRWKIVRLAYFPPWDWVIGTSAYDDELEGYRTILTQGRQRMTAIMGGTGIAITALMGLLGAFLSWIILVRPVRRLTGALETVIGGDLSGAVDVRAPDEIGVLARTFNIMSQKLKETVEGLRQSEEKYRAIFDNATEGVFQTSVEGRFLAVNPTMAAILGYDSPADLMEHVTDLRSQLYVRPADRDELVATLRAKGKSIGLEVQFRRKDGCVIWVSLTERLTQDGTQSRIEGFLSDVTERRRLETQLLQSQKMEAIGLLAGGVAHDFNNLLTPILGYAEILESSLSMDETSREQLGDIRRAAERAQDLTRRLLTFSRKQMIELKIIDLGDVIRHLQGILRRTIRENIHIDVDIAPTVSAVRADAGQIEQVLLNLAINAQDAMPAGGTLSIEAVDIDIDEAYAAGHPETSPGPHVMLAVSDTGVGMDDRTMEHLFEPFFTTKELGKGTGLGLSSVYGIVRQHGGTINVYSEKNHGSTFKILLPRAAHGAAGERRAAEPAETTRGAETILVVEDNAMVRTLACRMLSNLGYQVLVADTVEASIALAEAHKGNIALVLTDVIMPHMNGRELFNELHKRCPEMKALFMSGYPSNVIQHQGVLDEGMQFIQKPFTLHALSTKVRQALDSPGTPTA